MAVCDIEQVGTHPSSPSRANDLLPPYQAASTDVQRWVQTEFGYDLASVSVDLFHDLEVHTNGKISALNDEVERLVIQMEELEGFLATIAHKTRDSKRCEFSTAEEQQLIDHLRQEYNLSHILPHGTYTWVDQEVDDTKQMVQKHIESPLTSKIGRTTEKALLHQQELSKVLEAFNAGLRRMTDLIRVISNNIQRA